MGHPHDTDQARQSHTAQDVRQGRIILDSDARRGLFIGGITAAIALVGTLGVVAAL